MISNSWKRIADYGTSLGAAIATGYIGLGTDITRFNFDELTFETDPYRAGCVLLASLGTGMVTHKYGLSLASYGKQKIKELGKYLFEDTLDDPKKSRRTIIGCAAGFLGLTGMGVLALHGETLPYDTIGNLTHAKTVIKEIKKTSTPRERNLHFLFYESGIFGREQMPPNDPSTFEKWHIETKGIPSWNPSEMPANDPKSRSYLYKGAWKKPVMIDGKPFYIFYKVRGNRVTSPGFYYNGEFVVTDDVMRNHPDLEDSHVSQGFFVDGQGGFIVVQKPDEEVKSGIETSSVRIKRIGSKGLAFGGSFRTVMYVRDGQIVHEFNPVIKTVGGESVTVFVGYKDGKLETLGRRESGEESILPGDETFSSKLKKLNAK